MEIILKQDVEKLGFNNEILIAFCNKNIGTTIMKKPNW